MDYRRASRIAEWTLVAAVVLLHLVIFLWPETAGQPQYLVAAAHDAQLLSGSVLIFGWCILGPGSPWLRGGALPILAILWVLPWNERMLPRETSASFPVTIAIAAAVGVVALRLCGWHMRRLDPATGPERGAQFSLLGLLVATTLIAAVIGGLEALRPTLVRDREDEYLMLLGEIPRTPQQARQLVLGISVALASLGGLWIVARPGAVWFRLGAVVLALPLLGYYLAQLSGETDQRATVALNLAIGLGLVAGLTGLTVLPLRLLDYRLMRKLPDAGASSAPAKRLRSLTSRAAAIAAVLALLCLLPASLVVRDRTAERLSPPAATFAEWIQPRQRYVLYSKTIRAAFNLRLRSVRLIQQKATRLDPLPPRLLEFPKVGEINGWEYRNWNQPEPSQRLEIVIDDPQQK